MSKHTPGPWVAVRWSDDEVEAYGWSFSAGGHLLPLSDLETDNPDECDANARLIASAPDLLAVLQELEESARYWGEYDVPLGIVDRISAAIAKATGEKA